MIWLASAFIRSGGFVARTWLMVFPTPIRNSVVFVAAIDNAMRFLAACAVG
jgi:hypothetical protein